MITMPILSFAITGSILVVAGVATLLGGMFLGSQIDDKFDEPTAPIGQQPSIPTVIKWPIVIGGIVFVVIVARNLAKKVIK